MQEEGNEGDQSATASDPAEEQGVAQAAPAARAEDGRLGFQLLRQMAEDLEQGDFDLPPFPDTAIKVQACIRDPNTDNEALAAIIATEPALAARLMRMANSAMMRRGPIEVTDIPTAISRIGMQMVQNAAVSFAAREAFKPPPGSPCIDDLKRLRSISIKVAAISYVLATQLRGVGKPEEAMLAGLLGSLGKFYIFTKAADNEELYSDREALDEIIADWHTGVARAVVESWGFPDAIAIAVDEQELRERDRNASADLSDLLYVGNLLARAGVQAAGYLGDIDALVRMGVSGDRVAEILTENEEQIESMVAAIS
ncbi:MAG: HDOD domain-containing protein [Halioglobus sp.]|nr:HDOD domain-containing protein [Halioglobus sp.]